MARELPRTKGRPYKYESDTSTIAGAFGAELAGLRKGLTAQEAARRNGMSTSTWTRYEIGDRVPPMEKIVEICKAFGVKPSELFKCLDKFVAFVLCWGGF